MYGGQMAWKPARVSMQHLPTIKSRCTVGKWQHLPTIKSSIHIDYDNIQTTVQCLNEQFGRTLSPDTTVRQKRSRVYKGLDIITNKVTTEELKECPHHMIDFLSPLTRNYKVTDYRDSTLPIIERLLKQGKLPIIVGGTSYYIESLLWNFIVTKQDIEKAIKEDQNPAKRQKLHQVEPALDLSSKVGPAIVGSGGIEVKESSHHHGNKDTEVKDTSHHHGSKDLILDGAAESLKNCNNEECDTEITDISGRLKEFGDGTSEGEKYNGVDSGVLYERLKEVDPEMALMIHPNNRRKVVRALEVFDLHGVKLSSVHKAQRDQLSSQAPSGPLRFQNTCVFWLQSDLQELGKRTDDRVDKMIERGLIEELTDFHQQYNADRLQQESVPDYTHGIFQSIGFKEFHEYLVSPEEERNTDKGRQLFQEGVENLKKRTRAYAKYQVKHIRNRYIKRRGANTLPVYGLDVSDTTLWEDKVKTPAIEILTDILKGREPHHAPIPCEETDNYRVHEVCDICNDGRIFYTSEEWNSHLNSKRHERRKYMMRKKQRVKEKQELESSCTDQAGGRGDNSTVPDSVKSVAEESSSGAQDSPSPDSVNKTNGHSHDSKQSDKIIKQDNVTLADSVNISEDFSVSDSVSVSENGS